MSKVGIGPAFLLGVFALGVARVASAEEGPSSITPVILPQTIERGGALRISPDGRFLLVGRRTFSVIDHESGRVVRRATVPFDWVNSNHWTLSVDGSTFWMAEVARQDPGSAQEGHRYVLHGWDLNADRSLGDREIRTFKLAILPAGYLAYIRAPQDPVGRTTSLIIEEISSGRILREIDLNSLGEKWVQNMNVPLSRMNLDLERPGYFGVGGLSPAGRENAVWLVGTYSDFRAVDATRNKVLWLKIAVPGGEIKTFFERGTSRPYFPTILDGWNVWLSPDESLLLVRNDSRVVTIAMNDGRMLSSFDASDLDFSGSGFLDDGRFAVLGRNDYRAQKRSERIVVWNLRDGRSQEIDINRLLGDGATQEMKPFGNRLVLKREAPSEQGGTDYPIFSISPNLQDFRRLGDITRSPLGRRSDTELIWFGGRKRFIWDPVTLGRTEIHYEDSHPWQMEYVGSPGGHYVARADTVAGEIIVIDRTSSAQRKVQCPEVRAGGSRYPPWYLKWSDDEAYLILWPYSTAPRGAKIRIWEIPSGREVFSGDSTGGSVASFPGRDGILLSNGPWGRVDRFDMRTLHWIDPVEIGRWYTYFDFGRQSADSSYGMVVVGKGGRPVVTTEGFFHIPTNKIRLWSPGMESVLREMDLGPEDASVFFRDDGRLAAIHRPKNIQILDIERWEIVKTFEGDAEGPGGSGFFWGDRFYISQGESSKIWDLRTGEMIAAVHAWDDGEWLVRTPDNYYDASLHGDQHIVFRVGNNVVDASQYRSVFRRPDEVRARMARAFGGSVPDTPVARPLAVPVTVALPPTVELVSPSQGTEVAEGEVSVVAEAEDPAHPIRRWHILVNERPVEGERGIRIEDAEGGQTARLDRAVPLIEGPNRIQVTAENSEGVRSDEAEVLVTFRPRRSVRPRAFVLAVGVSDYADDRLDLRYAANDAQQLAASFVAQKGLLFEDVRVRVLADSAATRAAILAAKDEFLSMASIEDVVVVFVAGHGLKYRGNYYFLCQRSNPDRPYDEALTTRDLEGILDDLAPPRRILLLDACYSGAAMGERAVPQWDLEEVMRSFVEGSGIYVISASASREAALEGNEWGHGAFTKALVEGLDGQADGLLERDGVVTIEELKAYVSRRVVELTGGLQHPTYPLVRYGRDFPLAVHGR